MSLPAETPLNDKLRFITEIGEIDLSAIAADVPRRAAELERRHSARVTLDAQGWVKWAQEDLEAFAQGEFQLWEMRVIARGLTQPVAPDMSVPVAVGPYNDNDDLFEVAQASVRIAMAVH